MPARWHTACRLLRYSSGILNLHEASGRASCSAEHEAAGLRFGLFACLSPGRRRVSTRFGLALAFGSGLAFALGAAVVARAAARAFGFAFASALRRTPRLGMPLGMLGRLTKDVNPKVESEWIGPIEYGIYVRYVRFGRILGLQGCSMLRLASDRLIDTGSIAQLAECSCCRVLAYVSRWQQRVMLRCDVCEETRRPATRRSATLPNLGCIFQNLSRFNPVIKACHAG